MHLGEKSEGKVGVAPIAHTLDMGALSPAELYQALAPTGEVPEALLAAQVRMDARRDIGFELPQRRVWTQRRARS